MQKLTVDLIVAVDGGSVDHSWPKLVVEYSHYAGFRQTMTEPGEPEHVELGQIYVVIDGARHPLPEWQVEPMTEALEALALDHWRGERDDALERRAEERREDAMLDRRPQAAE